jgi:hypothetical protein
MDIIVINVNNNTIIYTKILTHKTAKWYLIMVLNWDFDANKKNSVYTGEVYTSIINKLLYGKKNILLWLLLNSLTIIWKILIRLNFWIHINKNYKI